MSAAEPAFPLRALWLRQSLRSPFLYLSWLLLVAIPLEEIGNASQPGRSGLVSLPGPAADWTSLAWICAVTSLAGLPIVYLAYEGAAQRIKTPGFLEIVMVSAGGEAGFRAAEMRVLPWLTLLLALPALILIPFAATGNAPHPGPAVYLATIGALGAILLPNLAITLCFALRWSNHPSRLLPLLCLALYPLIAAAAFRLLIYAMGDGPASLFVAAVEPTGTALFGALSGSGPPALSPLAALLLVANRLLAAGLCLWWLRGYRREAPFLEVRAGRTRLRLPPRLRSFGLPVAAGAVGALLSVSNLQSNFGKNLNFYEVDPTMSFLFDRAMGGLETPLLLLLPLIFIHAVWRDSESGFQVLRDMSARGEWRRAAGFLGSALACCLAFYAILFVAIFFGFGSERQSFDAEAILLHFAVNSMPTVLLVAFVGSAVSVLAPNRIFGIALLAAIGAALVAVSRSGAGLLAFATPLLPQPAHYSEALGRLAPSASLTTHALACLALVAAASALLIAAWPRPHRWSGFVRLVGDKKAALVFLGLAGGLTAAAAVAGHGSEGPADPSNDLNQREAYERAAVAVREPADWHLDRAQLRAQWADAGHLRLSGILHLSGRGRLLLSWAAAPDEIGGLRLNGAPIRARALGGGLYDLGTPGTEATLIFTTRLTGRSALLTTLYGDRPTVPLPGILPDTFIGDDQTRAERHMVGLRAAIVRFSGDRQASRPMAQVELILEHPCDLTLTAPFAPTPRRLPSGRCQAVVSPVTTRLELFAAVGPKLRASSVPAALPLVTLAPGRFAERQQRLDIATADASRDIATLMGAYPVPGITVAGAEAHELGSFAISKPGLIRVSDTYLLARRPGSPDPIYGTMAHELMHQYYGHWVRPVAGRPGAIFVNEFPAQLARAWAIWHRYGPDAYAAELSEATSRLYYVQHFQSAPEPPPVVTTGTDEIYPRSMLIVHYLASHSSWAQQAEAIRAFATRRGGTAVTAAEVAEAVLAPLAPQARQLGRFMLFDGLLIRRNASGGIDLDCGAGRCPFTDIDVPLRTAQGVHWVKASAYRTSAGPLVGIPLQ